MVDTRLTLSSYRRGASRACGAFGHRAAARGGRSRRASSAARRSTANARAWAKSRNALARRRRCVGVRACRKQGPRRCRRRHLARRSRAAPSIPPRSSSKSSARSSEVKPAVRCTSTPLPVAHVRVGLVLEQQPQRVDISVSFQTVGCVSAVAAVGAVHCYTFSKPSTPRARTTRAGDARAPPSSSLEP